MPNASFYEFGVLMSNVHMVWMRAVCGRLIGLEMETHSC